jgi:hypothetical protein
MIMAGQRLVLAQSGDPVENHGLAHDYVYGTGGADEVVLNNDNDELTLELADGTVLDRVAWPSTGFTRGASRQLPADVPTAMNEDWALWCDATRVYSMMGGTFLGSPQSANDATCP